MRNGIGNAEWGIENAEWGNYGKSGGAQDQEYKNQILNLFKFAIPHSHFRIRKTRNSYPATRNAITRI